jgi:hypothetical protein
VGDSPEAATALNRFEIATAYLRIGAVKDTAT